MSKRIPELQQEVLVLWGRNDEIVECKYAEMFARDLPHSRCDLALWHVNSMNCPCNPFPGTVICHLVEDI